jgi:CheY-like chemotaxis protein
MSMGSAGYSDFVSVASKLTRGQLLDILLDVEDRLRGLVRVVFARNRPDWGKLIPGPIREELEAEYGPGDGPEAAGRGDLLDRATLKQLIDTLLARWALFEPLMHDKTLVAAHLEEFRSWRNKLAHGRQPSMDDRVKIALVASEVGRQIPVPSPPERPALPQARQDQGYALYGRRILWADDRPENNRWERRWFAELGAEVVPVLSNDEAVQEATRSKFHVVVSDIDRGGAELGSNLGIRLQGAGVPIPIAFFVSMVDTGEPPPFGAVGITNDQAELLRMVIDVLRPRVR